MGGVYDTYDYVPEIEEALEIWANALMAVVEPPKIEDDEAENNIVELAASRTR